MPHVGLRGAGRTPQPAPRALLRACLLPGQPGHAQGRPRGAMQPLGLLPQLPGLTL